MSQSTWQILAAAAGWFVAAALGFAANRFLDRQRQDREHNGTKRQMRTLLRRIIAVIDPFFWSVKNIQLNDSIVTYQQVLERLSDRQTAVALNDAEWDVMDKLLSRYGHMVALTQTHWNQWEEEGRRVENPPESLTRRRGDELRLFCAQAFRDAMEPLGPAIQMFGDDELRKQYAELVTRADEFIERYLQLVSELFH
jgi:hypothetical protein